MKNRIYLGLDVYHNPGFSSSTSVYFAFMYGEHDARMAWGSFSFKKWREEHTGDEI